MPRFQAPFDHFDHPLHLPDILDLALDIVVEGIGDLESESSSA
jgi:hypothetical protein